MSLSLPTSSSQRFIGPYEIIRQIGLGTGGGLAGQAYLARDSRAADGVHAQVVVKLSTYDSGAIYQVETEARVLDGLRAAFEDAGTPKWNGRAIPIPWLHEGPLQLPNDRRVYLVEEYLTDPFVPLPELIRHGGLTSYNALELIVDLARLLEIAHDASIIHGDLNDRKIEHIFWDPWGRHLKVIDWGIADDPHVTAQRHLPNNDIQGLGTLLHVALTGESRSRETSLPDWAERIVRLCLDQDPANASLVAPIRALEDALREHRGPIRTAAQQLQAAVALPASSSRLEQVEAAVNELARLDPYHLFLRDADWLLDGQAAISAAHERFRRDLDEMFARSAGRHADPAEARRLAAAVAHRALDLDPLTVRARALDRGLTEPFAAPVPEFAISIDWAILAEAFELMGGPSFTLHAPAGPDSPPWTTFTAALRGLHLRNAADLLAEHPTLADPDPVAAQRRAAKLRMLLLSCWYRIHPVTDVEWHVELARVWRQAAETSGAMSRAALERWQRVLSGAASACLALRQPGPPGDVAARWEELARLADELDAESPERITREAPLQTARAILRNGHPRLNQLASAWRAGQYREIGPLVDGLLDDVPELATALSAWGSGAAPMRARQDAQRELLDQLTSAAHPSEHHPLDLASLVRAFESAARLDPGAPWIGAVRTGARALGELTASQDATVRVLGHDALVQLATAAEHQRQTLAQLGDLSILEAAIHQAARLVSGPSETFDDAAYQQAAGALGPIRPAFDAAIAAVYGRAGDAAVARGDWAGAATAFDQAAERLRTVDSVRARAYEATASAARALLAAFADLLDGDAARLRVSLRAVEQGGPVDADAVRAVMSTVRRLEPLQRQLGDLEQAIRDGASPAESRQYVAAISRGLDDPSIPQAVRDELQPTLATLTEALVAEERTPALVQLGQGGGNGWQRLAQLLAQQLLDARQPYASGTFAASAAGGSGARRRASQAAQAPPPRRRWLVVAAAGLCLLCLIVGAGALVAVAPWSAASEAAPTPTVGSGLASAGAVSGGGVTSLSPQAQAEQDAPGIVAAARAKANPPEQDADPAIEMLERLEPRLPQQSARRAEIQTLKAQIWVEDAERRITYGKEQGSTAILDQARERFEKAKATGKIDQRTIEDGLKRTELARQWLTFEQQKSVPDFQGAYDALLRIQELDAQSVGPNGTVTQKLYDTLIDWARALHATGALQDAMTALDRAETFDPSRNEARDLRVAWTPTPTAIPRPAAPPPPPAAAPARPGGGPAAPQRAAPQAPPPAVAPPAAAPPPVVAPPPIPKRANTGGGRE